MSDVPTLRGTAPAPLVVIFVAPYGLTKVYSVSGHRPPVTEIRLRPNMICSVSTGSPLMNVASTAWRMNALPVGPPSQPGVVMMSESATV